MNQSNVMIRIIGVPPGEAPLWVREKWLGLKLPLARSASPAPYLTFGVLSAPPTWLGRLWAIMRRKANRTDGYPVEGRRAVEILEKTSPEAAAWWREHAAQWLVPNRHLLFNKEVCERVTS